MKAYKCRVILAIILLAISSSTSGLLLAQDKRLAYDLEDLKLVPPEDLPKHGTFWRLQRAVAPLPFNPFAIVHTNLCVDVYALPNGSFLIDDLDVDYTALESASAKSSGGVLGECDGPETEPRNYAKFVGQLFTLINTNFAAGDDTNLYNACISFPDETNSAPTLQISSYGPTAVIIKANRFDYSAETDQDFALLICDAIDKPLWKNVDLEGASDSQDGWLIQGLVANWEVTDPMFMMVTNISRDFNAFFRAIPYSGPHMQLTGAQPYDVVSNTVTLTVGITDLSGTTNHQVAILLNGLPARHTLGTSNTINIDTRYAASGNAEVSVTVGNQSASLYDPQNAVTDNKLQFTSTATLPLTRHSRNQERKVEMRQNTSFGRRHIFEGLPFNLRPMFSHKASLKIPLSSGLCTISAR